CRLWSKGADDISLLTLASCLASSGSHDLIERHRHGYDRKLHSAQICSTHRHRLSRSLVPDSHNAQLICSGSQSSDPKPPIICCGRTARRSNYEYLRGIHRSTRNCVEHSAVDCRRLLRPSTCSHPPAPTNRHHQ